MQYGGVLVFWTQVCLGGQARRGFNGPDTPRKGDAAVRRLLGGRHTSSQDGLGRSGSKLRLSEIYPSLTQEPELEKGDDDIEQVGNASIFVNLDLACAPWLAASELH